MDNRIIGFFIVGVMLNIAIGFTIFIDGTAGRFVSFISVPSAILVYGAGGGMTYMRKHLLKENELGIELKKNLILAGWIGFMLGLVLLGVGMDGEGGQDNFGGGFAGAVISVLYGYLYGNIAEAFLTKQT